MVTDLWRVLAIDISRLHSLRCHSIAVATIATSIIAGPLYIVY